MNARPNPPTDAWEQPLPQAHARVPPPDAGAQTTAALTAALALDAPPLPSAMSPRLAQRVAASAAASAALLTRRRPQQQAAQTPWGAGLQAWPLGPRSWLVQAEAGATLPPQTGSHELLLLNGAVQAGALTLAPHDFLLLDAATPLHALQTSRFYLRLHGADDPFHAAPSPAQPLRHQAQAWQPLRKGVDIATLHSAGEAASMLARFAPGARVPAHAHGLHEECLMVEGELFLGDVLLPEGGFQLAPAGSAHGELLADSPCLLFFHGAIDAQAIDNDWRQQQGWPAM